MKAERLGGPGRRNSLSGKRGEFGGDVGIRSPPLRFSEPGAVKDVLVGRRRLRSASLAFARLFSCQILNLGSPHASIFVLRIILAKV